MQIELIQPVRGEGLHVEFLASNGPGLHHLGFLVDDLDAVVALGAASGFPKLMGSHVRQLALLLPRHVGRARRLRRAGRGSRPADDVDHALAVIDQPAIEKPPSTASVWPVM